MKTSKKSNFHQFHDFIIDKDHPCLMAQSAFQSRNVTFKEYMGFGLESSAGKIIADLDNYLSSIDLNSNEVYSFIAAFTEDQTSTEIEFEEKLWKLLQILHESDEVKWDPKVDKDPSSSNFSFSLRGHSFYIIGMHPNSSRIARQSPCPAMIFNLHSQFEMLRGMNVYGTVKQNIRNRDKALQGSINPMLADFGEESEALQYSGRKVDKSWKCPFHSK